MRRFAIVAVFMLFSGCALISKFQEMTPKQKALWFMRAYNAEYMDVLSQAQYYDLMPANAQQVLRWRAKLIQELYPLIGSYVLKVENDIEPTKEEENAITDLLNRLMAVDPADVAKNAPAPPDRSEEGKVAGEPENKEGSNG